MSGYSCFAYYYDKLTQNISYKDRAGYYDSLVKKHGGRKGILLDLACGTGSLRLSRAFAENILELNVIFRI